MQNYKLDPFQFSHVTAAVAAPSQQQSAFLHQHPNLPPQFMSAVTNGPSLGPSYEANVEVNLTDLSNTSHFFPLYNLISINH